MNKDNFIENLEGLERDESKAWDSHELMKAHEAKSMVTAVLMIPIYIDVNRFILAC